MKPSASGENIGSRANMATTEQITEKDKVDGWRQYVAYEAGAPVEIAEKVAANWHIDLHRFVELLDAGCDPEMALDILL